MKNKENIDTLVFSGGGLKGISYIGVLKKLEELDVLKNIKIIAGSSVGSVIGCLYTIGYSPEELKELVFSLDFSLFRHIDINDFFTNYGIDNGKKIEHVLSKIFEEKNYNPQITFSELYEKTNMHLIFTTVCVNEKKTYYLSHETFPEMPVIIGMRMSFSVPFWLHPVKYQNKLFVDGGIMDNYPINLFRKKKNKVLGVYINEKKEQYTDIQNIETFIFSTLDCVVEGISKNYIEKYKKQTILLNVPKMSIFSFNIDEKMKIELYDYGYNATKLYFDDYKKNVVEEK